MGKTNKYELFLFGWTSLLEFLPMSTYFVDIHQRQALKRVQSRVQYENPYMYKEYSMTARICCMYQLAWLDSGVVGISSYIVWSIGVGVGGIGNEWSMTVAVLVQLLAKHIRQLV